MLLSRTENFKGLWGEIETWEESISRISDYCEYTVLYNSAIMQTHHNITDMDYNADIK